jgi:hypothetical protein
MSVITLPVDILHVIYGKLSVVDVWSVALTCRVLALSMLRHSYGETPTQRQFYQLLTNTAIANNNADLLRLVLSQTNCWDYRCGLTIAILSDSLEMLADIDAYDLAESLDMDDSLTENYQLLCDGWQDQRCVWWDADLTARVASVGDLDAVTYLHQQGCDWDERTVVNAADNEHIEIVRYAVENGCYWTSWSFVPAAQRDNREILEYALEQIEQGNSHIWSWSEHECVDEILLHWYHHMDGSHSDCARWIEERLAARGHSLNG